MTKGARDVVVAVLIVALAALLGYGLLYAYRSQAPGQPVMPMFGIAAVLMFLLPIILLVLLVLIAARAFSRARTGERNEALTRVADLRDRGVLSEDEFQREKRRILE